ncbi:MAG: hypothetical protein JW786_09170, partial [Desulfobacterales bacterium]|nr:hypothetical protein [Desulfobacterales bacterium]
MKKLIIISYFLLMGVVYAQDQQSDAWRQDLDYLIRRIDIMHPNPYAFFPKEEFYKLKEKLYNEIPNLSDADIVISISELLATLKDGHTQWAFERSDPQWLDQTFHMLPIIQYPFEDGVYILAGIPQYGELVGLKVTKIGKMPIAEVTSKLGKIWSHDNPFGERKFIYYSLSIAEMLKKVGALEDVSKIEIQLQNTRNEEFKAQIPTVSFFSMVRFFAGTWYPQSDDGLVTMNEKAENPLPLWLKNKEKSFWFESVPEEKMMFLQINSLNFPHGKTNEEDSFSQLCELFFEAFDQSTAEKLVIDIRRNTGGNHVELPLLKGILERPNIDKPDKLFLITGRVTFSAAVHLTTILERYTNITIIGEPASGRPNHFGASRGFRLPNHPQIEICCSIDYYQDSEPFDFNIIKAPDILTEMTAAEYQNNIDPAMQAVKDYDKIINLVKTSAQKLEQAYTDYGINGIKETYYSEKQTLIKSDYNLEKLFKEFYYQFLSKNAKSTVDLLD